MRHFRLVLVCAALSFGPSTLIARAADLAEVPQAMLAGIPEIHGEAPDFQYLAHDGHWGSLGDLRSGNDLLLVFEPGDAQLLELQREAGSLLDQGVTPVAVLDRSEADNWSAIERLGLTYSLLSDPGGDLSAEFQVRDAESGRVRPSWFLVGRDGHVRGLGRDRLPAAGFVELVEGALRPAQQASRDAIPRP